MLFTSQIVSAASGSVGGLTASRNSGGNYFRARTVPTNPNSPAQDDVRTKFGTLVNRWVNTLTQAQRDLWQTYADNVPIIGPLGNSRLVSALNQYLRSNTPRRRAGLARVDVAPTVFDTGDFTAVTSPAADVTMQQVQFAFTDTDDWVGEDGASMLVYVGIPQNPTINFFRGPFRFAGRVDGDSVTPPTSPAAIATPFAFVAGQKVFFRVVVTRADARYSLSQQQEAIAA